MKQLNNWFLWRLVWDATEQKYEKKPCDLTGNMVGNTGHPSKPENRYSYDQVRAALDVLHAKFPPRSAVTYTLGFWLTEDCGYWFFDMDNAVQDGQVVPMASQLLAMFPGAMWEWSSSSRGLHVIGRGPVPEHRTKPTKETKALLGQLELEFYNKGRGIAFGFDPWSGDPDTSHDAAVQWLCANYFPPPAKGEGTDVRRPEWRGPENDDELIARMLRSRQSAESAFGGKASLRDLWEGNAPEGNESDMALAAHLAFWTGCDGDRIERLMRRSGLYRAKWDTHKTYLRELTIKNACAGCNSVYVEPVTPPVSTVIAPVNIDVDEWLKTLHGTETFSDVVNLRIPEAQNMNLHPMDVERVALQIKSRLKALGGDYQIGKLRALLSPKTGAATINLDTPVWAQKHCYVRNGDFIFDVERSTRMSVNGFNATYIGAMPLKPNGRRENPFEWAIERWGMVTVDDALYVPYEGPYFSWAGKEYVNLFSPTTMPERQPVVEAQDGIQRFTQHLWLICGEREDVYWNLLKWMAYNVQNPGKKIKWMPLVVGAQGDGKSILADVLRAAMGDANVSVTSLSTLKNSGGFTDWAYGSSVNFIEEIYMVGEARYEIYEAMKNFIELGVININAKGKKTFDVPNCMNHMASSNHKNAMPLPPGDRRVMVIFSPYTTADDAARARGLRRASDIPTYINVIGESCRAWPGQWREWFCQIDLSDFTAFNRAPETPEKLRMIAMSKDSLEDSIEHILEAGGPGISREIFVSSHVRQALKVQATLTGESIPATTAWANTLIRMGYEKFPKPIKWNNTPQTIYHLPGISEDQVRNFLNG